jgi:hypothetical protein
VRSRWIAASLFLAGALEAAGVENGQEATVRFAGSRSSAFEQVLASAFADAARWLRRDPCLRLLSEFHDSAGRPLSRRLEHFAMSADAYLAELVVVDGDRRAMCQSSRVLAVTRTGNREVAFCGRRFARIGMRDPDLARRS